MKTLGLIAVSSITIHHTDSFLQLGQPNFLEVGRHLYQFHLVPPKDGTSSVSPTWQMLTLYCFKW